MQTMERNDKTIIAAYFNAYGKKIIATIESVLSDLGAKDIKITGDLLEFRIDSFTKTINVKTLMFNIFCDGNRADPSVSSPETMLKKTLNQIEQTLKSL